MQYRQADHEHGIRGSAFASEADDVGREAGMGIMVSAL